MKTNVREVSRDTYRTITSNGLTERTTEKIMNALYHHPNGLLMSEIADETGLRINQVSGRCNELKKAGLIGEGETVETTKGHYATRLYIIRKADTPYPMLSDGQFIFV